MKVIKRSGEEVAYDELKILNAVHKALESANSGAAYRAHKITDLVDKDLQNFTHAPHVEEIQDLIQKYLFEAGELQALINFTEYRYEHALRRKANTTDQTLKSLLEHNNEELKQENSNKNPMINSVQRDYMAGEVSKDLSRRFLLPQHIVEAHDKGLIHFHDMDYFAQPMYNCCLINLEDMLQNGTCISGVKIDRPKSFTTACTIATQIIAQVASNQYGGQSISLAHLAPFVQVSREKIRRQVIREVDAIISLGPGDETGYDVEDIIEKITESRVREEIKHGVQTIQYQVTTLMTTNGQAPFLTVYMYLNEAQNEQEKKDLALIMEEVLRQRILGVKNEKGVYITPAFPKLIFVLQEDSFDKSSPYYYLTCLAATCTAKRMVPDYISEKIMKELKQGDVYPIMGCRSILTPREDHKYYGRFNQGVVTLNLVDVACSSGRDLKDFWRILHERMDLCYEALMIRHKRLLGTTSDSAPILWQHGALARLGKGEKIDPLLYDNYSTISLGYAGLAECVRYMTGASHTGDGFDFGIQVMRVLKEQCDEWRAKTNISFSLYGTPMESTTYRFAKCLQNRWGIIEGVTDRNYITNSYHIHVTEEIDAFTKLSLESKFQELSPGGAISYIEAPYLGGNLDTVEAIMKHIYENIMYAEINIKSDYCQKCGYDGEIQIVEDDGKLVWECPNCGNRDENLMNVARRTCGYIGTQFFNQGRTAEVRDRVLHL